VEEAQREGRTWTEVKWFPADRSRWRSFEKALCSYTGDNRTWWLWLCCGTEHVA
jgi:hypothetical protein